MLAAGSARRRSPPRATTHEQERADQRRRHASIDRPERRLGAAWSPLPIGRHESSSSLRLRPEEREQDERDDEHGRRRPAEQPLGDRDVGPLDDAVAARTGAASRPLSRAAARHRSAASRLHRDLRELGAGVVQLELVDALEVGLERGTCAVLPGAERPSRCRSRAGARSSAASAVTSISTRSPFFSLRSSRRRRRARRPSRGCCLGLGLRRLGGGGLGRRRAARRVLLLLSVCGRLRRGRRRRRRRRRRRPRQRDHHGHHGDRRGDAEQRRCAVACPSVVPPKSKRDSV